MPLWRIFSHPGVFSPAQRQSISQAITDVYVNRRLPAFYVNVIFIDTPDGSVFIGGVENKNFVRIVTEHIAKKFADGSTEEGKQYRKSFMDLVGEKILKPFILSRPELDVEHHIFETPRDLWRIQNISPPPSNSEEEKAWFGANKPVPYY